jgi:DNA-binding NtrC family response regulator
VTTGTPKPKIAIVDSDPSLRSKISAAFRTDFELLQGEDYEDAYSLLQESQLDVLLLGTPMGSGDGVPECVELLERLAAGDIDTLVIVLSSDERKTTALKVIDAGAHDYFIKPIDMDVLRALLNRSIEKLHVQRENRILRDELTRKNALGDLVGSTESMRHVLDSIRRMAKANTNVIVRGESGTGKELVARALHDQSPRRSRPFISVNCAALPESLMESELFGYERGAFTGAVAAKEGRIELANHGTLFLDEIATLTPALQSKLLRVLEERALLRLGGKKPIKVDFRLVCATNENLEEMVKNGKFREDLYYRIHVVPIFVPPLRERADDIPILIEYFLTVYCAANQVPMKRLSDEALQALKRYSWPGNVRELQNVVQRIVLMADEQTVSLENLPGDVLQATHGDPQDRFHLPPTGIRLDEEIEAFERQWVETALNHARHTKSEAARLLGVDRNRMNYLCRKYSL